MNIVHGSQADIYITTVLKDDCALHYEYIGGFVELHLEGKYQSADS